MIRAGFLKTSEVLLGAGGLCEVVAKDEKVVLKRLKKRWRGQIAYEALLEREFEILKNLHHPFLIATEEPLHSSRRAGGRTFSLALERVDGPSLAQLKDFLMSWDTGFRDEWLRSFLPQALSVLGYLHLHQIFHLDLCPDHFMFSKTGYLKLIDFGVSEAPHLPPLAFQIAGREKYRAPDAWSSASKDLFALGRTVEDFLSEESCPDLKRAVETLKQGLWPEVLLKPQDWFSPVFIPDAESWASVRALTSREVQTAIIPRFNISPLQLKTLRHVVASFFCLISLTSFHPQNAFLTVNSLPVTRFFLDGRSLETPVLNLEVKSGSYEIRFVVPSQDNRVIKRKVDLLPGGHVQIFEDFENLDNLTP